MKKINWKEALALERDVAIIISRQVKQGVCFNKGKAIYFISLLESLKEKEYAKVRKFLKPDVIIQENKDIKSITGYSWVKKIKLKNGEYTESVKRWYPDPDIVSGEFSRISFEEPSISSCKRLIPQLLSLGWKPREFTEKGQPKITIKGEPVESLSEFGELGKAIATWLTYNQRQSSIRGYLEHVRPDGRIPAECISCGTNTFRAVHRKVANIPRPTSLFGKEMRSLFTVPNGRKFVGVDASGLELRMLAHHMNDILYTQQILSGDIHSYNQEKAGLPTRDNAKTFIYGFLYGAGDAKIGSIVGGNSTHGRKLKESFLEAIPSLNNLITKCKKFAEKHGYLPSIDNRKIYLRRDVNGRVLTHTALNALLQANGSIVVKRAMVIANEEIANRGLDAHQIIFYHDELDYECSEEVAEEVGQIVADAMKKAGEFYNLNIPLAGEYKIGVDWSVH